MNLEISGLDQSNPRPLLHTLTNLGVDLGEDVLAEIVTITPRDAAQWLKANRYNRPVVRGHVHFLAQQIIAKQWQLNGQAIVVSDGENILDGQHRLLAVIEAGIEIKTLVVYGISEEAFKTIDTGRVRSAADALSLFNRGDENPKTVAAAVRYLQRLENQFYGVAVKMSNTDVLQYVEEHPSIVHCVEFVLSLPKENRPLSVSCGAALYEFFSRKHSAIATEFIKGLYTGENLTARDPEFKLRTILQRDAQRLQKFPTDIRMKMAVKAWNLRRRGTDATNAVIVVQMDDPKRYVAL